MRFLCSLAGLCDGGGCLVWGFSAITSMHSQEKHPQHHIKSNAATLLYTRILLFFVVYRDYPHITQHKRSAILQACHPPPTHALLFWERCACVGKSCTMKWMPSFACFTDAHADCVCLMVSVESATHCVIASNESVVPELSKQDAIIWKICSTKHDMSHQIAHCTYRSHF